MGAWGITMRESDDGLDMLDHLIVQQLKKVDFASFNVSEAIKLLRQDVLEVIKKANRGCSPEELKFYIEENFPRAFAEAALLIAECLADYYRTGELIVYDYIGEDYNPVEHRIKEFAVTRTDLQLLMRELEKVQDPEHEVYQSWIREEIRREWLSHIQGVYQTLKEHI